MKAFAAVLAIAALAAPVLRARDEVRPPATPGAIEYTAGIVRDIVQRYAVDGVHFDRLRYPNDHFDYGRETLRAFVPVDGAPDSAVAFNAQF